VYLRVFKAVRKNGAEWIKANRIDDGSVADALRRGGEQATLLLPHHLPPSEIARAKALCQQTGAKLNVLMPDCNSWGVAKAGILPDLLPGMKTFADAISHLESFWKTSLPSRPGLTTDGMFDGVLNGSVQMLYIMGADPAQKFYDRERAVRALEAAPFTVVQELFLTDTARRADVVLPASSFAEKDGTFVNIEGREQKIKQALAPKGDSRPDWRIIADLMARLGRPVPYFSARDIYREYSRAIPKPPVVMAGAAA
jgi:predicted molibdopterin-dependent oxidoreductase YjgC